MNPSLAGLGQPATEPGAEKRCLNSELWHACAGPLVCLPNVGTRVVYFPQGHSEQIAATTNKEVERQIPNYPNLPAHLICQLHNVTMHVDAETDDVYAQMTLQPLRSEEQKESYVPIDMAASSKQPTNYFFKMLTASDTSTHGGFSVPRRAAEKVFPPLDFSQQPPAQELFARDIHDVEWKFRHIFRGQPKRHLLTTGWSVFVSAKRLVAGDSVLFIWNEKNELWLGVRRASRQQTVMPSSVLSSDSMHIGLLAAAAHAAATSTCFTIFYNPRASPSEFVIPLAKYVKAVFHTRASVGMRFRMLFETEESSVRRYMGTITGISDLDPVRWSNSQWRSVKVGWDESTAGERPPRVSLWEIEPLTTFPMYPSLFPLRLKRPWHPGLPSHDSDGNTLMWLRGDGGDRGLQALNSQSFNAGPWIQQRYEPLLLGNAHDQFQTMSGPVLQNIRGVDILKQQFANYQQPFQFSQQYSRALPMSQQTVQQTNSQSILENQMRSVQHQQPPLLHVEQPMQQIQRPQAYGTFFDTGERMQQQQCNVHSQSCEPLVFHDSSTNHLGSARREVGSEFFNFSRLGQPMTSERSEQPWEPKVTMSQTTPFGSSVLLPSFSEKDGSVETESCTVDSENHTLFGVGIDSPSILANAVPGLRTFVTDPDISTEPYTATCIQNSLYCSLDESSGLLQSVGGADPPASTFVKVYKSGSVGRSLDISQFSNYEELRAELGEMFGIRGQFEDPFRSGWQLLFVDRENDVLLLGDDPWEQFVNSVWYIKILSPEDVQNMGKQGD
nr:ARF12 [Lilium hybrid cultivar]